MLYASPAVCCHRLPCLVPFLQHPATGSTCLPGPGKPWFGFANNDHAVPIFCRNTSLPIVKIIIVPLVVACFTFAPQFLQGCMVWKFVPKQKLHDKWLLVWVCFGVFFFPSFLFCFFFQGSYQEFLCTFQSRDLEVGDQSGAEYQQLCAVFSTQHN